MSWRVMQTLRVLAGDRAKVEVYSVDEAFVDLADVPADELNDYTRRLRETVEQWTGISVSIGVAPTKTLAKMANRIAKKNKMESGCVTVLATPDDRRSALQATRVDSLWGVGWSYASKLINLGITSAWELSRMPEEWAHSNLGGVTGVRLVRELNGLPAIFMDEELTDKRMIATTRMFGRPVTSLTEIREAVATYISRAAEKLRRQHSAAGVVSVFIVPKDQPASASAKAPGPQSNPTAWESPTSWGRGHGATVSSYTLLPNPTSLTNELIKAAVGLADRIFENGKAYKKAGVMLSGLVPDDSIQGNLFVPQAANQHRFLMHAIDNINFSMRDDSAKFGASGLTKDWKMRQELRSKRHSTRWDELRTVK
jgi:DNA polymerase V